jgi:uncharacterized protein
MAAVKELSVAEKLKQLFELQMIDSELDQIGVLKGELPMEVADLEDEIAGLDTRLQRMKAQIKEAEQEVARHTANIKDANTHIERYTKQLDNVKNNREFEALQKEVENQKLEIQLSEKRIKEHKGIAAQKQEAFTTTEQRLTQKNKDVENKKVELAQIIEKTEKEEEKLLKRTEKARKKIEERLLAAYDKTRKSYRNGLAVVKVERDACGGCFNKVPAQIQIEIALRKKIVACEHCGRVLVDNDILNAEEILPASAEA